MKPYYQEPSATVYHVHALDLKELPPESVDMCMTSPPYWGLRSYKTEPQIWGDNHCEHEWGDALELPPLRGGSKATASAKQCSNTGTVFAMQSSRQAGNFCLKCNAWRGELGLEPTIELYIKHLMQIFNEVKRVLKKTGTCWVVIDDSYAGGKGQSGCGDPEYQENRTDTTLNKPYHQMGGHGMTRLLDGKIGVPAKSLCLIPSRFALAMSKSGWLVRNDIVWNKPNPMPESVKDRFTGSWEHLFFFSKSKHYFFEQQFEPMAYPDRIFNPNTNHHAMSELRQEGNRTTYGNPELGRNMRDVWEICTVPSPKHDGIRNFATYPEKLCETPILAGCPSQICKKCGKAREKVYKKGFTDHNGDTASSYEKGTTANRLALLRQASREKGEEYANDMEFEGYTDCGCNAGFEPGVALDPFCGSGTTLAVAKRLGRKAIGIDINPDYCKLAVKRLQEIPLSMELV